MKEDSKSDTSATDAWQGPYSPVVLLSFWFIYQQIKSSDIDILNFVQCKTYYFYVDYLHFWRIGSKSNHLEIFDVGSGADVPYRLCFGIWWTTNIAKYVPGKVSLIAEEHTLLVSMGVRLFSNRSSGS